VWRHGFVLVDRESQSAEELQELHVKQAAVLSGLPLLVHDNLLGEVKALRQNLRVDELSTVDRLVVLVYQFDCTGKSEALSCLVLTEELLNARLVFIK
jgi:hypothetical protein